MARALVLGSIARIVRGASPVAARIEAFLRALRSWQVDTPDVARVILPGAVLELVVVPGPRPT
ncbi:MAG: hypothetical protein E6J91_38855 [Deltaproteobacteria bacterium]|nr:MAG: hypothetical protein E6J91_38855 [Deltaproteobacteria bacterium]